MKENRLFVVIEKIKIKKSAIKNIIFLCVIAFLNGCVLAPGMDMNNKPFSHSVRVEGLDRMIPIQPITQALIAELTQEKSKRIQAQLPKVLIEQSKAQTKEYRIGVNDVLNITVWGLPELMPQGVAAGNQSPIMARHVRSDGTIFFPYAGVQKVAGLTREQIRKNITKKLLNYFKSPQVDVAVADFRSKNVVLTGAFSQAGIQPITTVPLSLSQAMGGAGRILEGADLTDVRLIRDEVEYSINYLELAKTSLDVHHIYLKDKDIVHLPLNQSNNAYVFGEVNRPTAIPMAAGTMTLTDALGASGSMDQRFSSGNEVYVIRGMAKLANAEMKSSAKPAIYKLESKSPTSFLLASNFSIQAQDVVFVGPAELTKWNRVIAQIFPFTRFLTAVDDLSN